MPLPKLRKLDQLGVIADVDGFDLPPNAWTTGVNVRFRDGRVRNAPLWRSVGSTLNADPRFVYIYESASNTSATFIGHLTGRVYGWTPTTQDDMSIAAYADSAVEAAWSGCSLAGVVYMNRQDRVPWSLTPAATDFAALANWNAGWRAKVFRAYNSALVALNVTKAGNNFPTMVKTSDIVEAAGTVPTTWDETDPTNNATENPLTEMRGEILDAQPQGDSLILYSSVEPWIMRADGSSDVYQYRKLAFTGGVVNTNCVAVVDDKHYVFGTDDIWMHDGIQRVSIIEGRNKDFVFKSLNAQKARAFFVAHDPSRKEIAFCYASGDVHTKFVGIGCNRAAVFNYGNNTWSFDDLPLVFSAGYTVAPSTALTWTSVTQTWEGIGGSWQDLEDGFKRVPVFVGESSATYALSSRIYARDLYGAESTINHPVDTNATKGMTLERLWLDLDDLDADLSGYKHITRIYPQGRMEPDAAPVQFSLGVSDYASEQPVYETAQDYDGASLYCLDFTKGGRFLHLKAEYDDYKTMSLSGFDIDLVVTGER